jgi:hypothetical protein
MKIKMVMTGMVMMICVTAGAYAGVGLGADVMSRYIWRGTDFGNSASVQPTLNFSTSHFEAGVWANYALTSNGADENDLYLTYSAGCLTLGMTDYYFPNSGDVFNYKDSDSIHFLEISAGLSYNKLSLNAGYFFSGDPENSVYAEAGYQVLSNDEMTAKIILAAGNGMYVVKDDFNAVTIGLTVTKGALSATYLLNPDAEKSFVVFGYSF